MKPGKIQELEQRLAKLEQNAKFVNWEIQDIKSELAKYSDNVVIPQTASQEVERPVLNTEQVSNPEVNVAAIQRRPKKDGKTTEQIIGKTAMGIGASILVFIAMVMFATLLLPMLDDTVKMISMYLFSILLIAAGELVYRKGKNAYTILSGCGVGALFISIVATCVYFHAIGTIALYFLLMLWVFGVAFYLARNRSWVFVVVGQIGIVIATVLPSFGVFLSEDALMMLGFILISEAAFFFSFLRKKFVVDVVNCTGFVLSLVILTGLVKWRIPDPTVQLIANIFAMICFVGIAIYMRTCTDTENGNIVSRIFTTAMIVLFAYIASATVQPLDLLYHWTSLFTCAYGLFVLFLFETRENTVFVNVMRSIQILFIMVAGCQTPEVFSLWFTVAALASFGIYGLLTKKKYYYFVPSGILLVLFDKVLVSSRGFFYESVPDNLYIICMLIGVALMVAHMIFIRMNGERYDLFEIISYVALIISSYGLVAAIPMSVDMYVLWVLAFAVWAVIQIVVKLTRWGMKSEIPFFVVNGLLMLAVLPVFGLEMPGAWMIMAILAAAVLYSLNVTNLFKVSRFAGAYIAFKYTVLLAVILNALDVPNQIMSIVFLAIAAVSIVVGFNIKNKSLRLYGLVLSIIGVAKLVLIDITYDNSLMRACSFLICGLICFGISILYNKMEKRMVNDEHARIEDVVEVEDEQ